MSRQIFERSDADASALAGAAARQRCAATVAKAAVEELEEAWATLPDRPAYVWLRRPEIGLAMVRGRIGGTGAPFNLGEMTMTRAAVQIALPDGTAVAGFGHVAGRDARHAELAAALDAMVQHPAWRDAVERQVIAPLAERHRVRKAARAAAVASSKVEFFTMVRGE
jgi:alpha-D-ribose 1-methylphosphonate 5-triphosphate synthase subunit PhnG